MFSQSKDVKPANNKANFNSENSRSPGINDGSSGASSSLPPAPAVPAVPVATGATLNNQLQSISHAILNKNPVRVETLLNLAVSKEVSRLNVLAEK